MSIFIFIMLGVANHQPVQHGQRHDRDGNRQRYHVGRGQLEEAVSRFGCLLGLRHRVVVDRFDVMMSEDKRCCCCYRYGLATCLLWGTVSC